MSDASLVPDLDGPGFDGPGFDGPGSGGGFALSLVCGFGALAASAALVASAGSLGHALELVLVFAVLTALECAAYAEAVRPWLGARRIPGRAKVTQGLVVVLALLAFIGGPAMGLVGLCALAAGVFLPNASLIRTTRVDRSFTNPAGPGVRDARVPRPLTPATEPPPTRARPVAKVGLVLEATVAACGDRWLAWAAATLAVTVSSLALQAPGEVVLVVDFAGVTALAWATQRLLAARLAQRDFEEAATEPHLGFVVLVRDSKVPGMRPLLGVWGKEPLPTEDRLPRAQAVYRCDRERAELVSAKGALVVYRAWVDTGLHPGARPRWVAADAGIALPRRRSVLGSWYLDSLIGSERSPRARPLTRPAPDPTSEAETGTFVTVISEPTRETGRLVRLFVRRLVALSLVGLVLGWLRSG